MSVSTQDNLAQVHIDDHIAYLCIDVQDDRVNTLSTAMITRFEEIFANLKQERDLQGVVLHSGKPDSFIAGFDIKELQAFQNDPDGLYDLVMRGHTLMNGLSTLHVPVVAAIHGTCLGGGLEVALACTARVATDHPKTKLGLPEVMLGVLPGGGGTQRLTRLIDLQVALDMVLTGKQQTAKKALKLGLVNEVVHPGALLQAAAKLAKALHADHAKPTALDQLNTLIDNPIAQTVKLVAHTPARKLLFDKARQQVIGQTKGHYPAPLKIIDVIEAGFAHGFEAGLEAERRGFVELVSSEVASALMGIFFKRNEVQKDPVVSEDVSPIPVHKIGILGAGLMGAGIAQVGAYEGYAIRLKDRDLNGLGWGMDYCQSLFDKLVKRRKISPAQADIKMGHITGTTDYSGLKHAELIIEAVFEDLDLKQRILADIEALGNETQIFASNTSTIPIAKIAEHAKRPENVLGMHYFSPVHKMPLLEIIKTPQTRPEAIATALAIGRKMGKTCIVVNDGPGFFTSRVIGAYINEAGWLLQEGARIEDIDRAMERFGFPVGPMKLIDEVGIDVGVKAGAILKAEFEARWDAPRGLEVIVDDGRKGKKNGRGFYLYGAESKGPDASIYDLLPNPKRVNMDAELIMDRCWLAMLNECVYCLQEDIAQHPRDIDIGVIFGLGFPPFKGGILNHADNIGISRVTDKLQRLAETVAPRLAPAQLLVDMAKSNKTFY